MRDHKVCFDPSLKPSHRDSSDIKKYAFNPHWNSHRDGSDEGHKVCFLLEIKKNL